MCYPAATQAAMAVINAATTTANAYMSYKQESENNEYRKQVAINNIKNLENEALRQNQLGIEKAREQRLEGIKKANTAAAISAASGFDMNSFTTLQNYSDVLNNSEISASAIQDEYKQNAESYLNRANSILNEYNNYSKNHNSNLYKSAINSLGNYTKVAQNWYTRGNQQNVYF